MNKEVYDNHFDLVRYKYNKAIIANVFMAIAVIVLSATVVFFSVNQRIVLKSPYSTTKDEIVGNGIEDPERLFQFASYITSCTQNVTYLNVKKSLLHILPLVESENFTILKKNLQKESVYF